MVKNLPAIQETQVRSLDWEDSPGEGNGNPLQYSCLENPMDRGAWWATVHGVTKSRTRLTLFTFTWSTEAAVQNTTGRHTMLHTPEMYLSCFRKSEIRAPARSGSGIVSLTDLQAAAFSLTVSPQGLSCVERQQAKCLLSKRH